MNSQLIYTSFDFVKDGFFAALPVKTLLAIHLFFKILNVSEFQSHDGVRTFRILVNWKSKTRFIHF